MNIHLNIYKTYHLLSATKMLKDQVSLGEVWVEVLTELFIASALIMQ